MRKTQCLLKDTSKRCHSAFQYDPYNALTQIFPIRETTATKDDSLHNLKYAVKENICTENGSTTCSSEVLGATSGEPYTSPFAARCVEILSDHGAHLLAKCNMDEFGMGSATTNTPFGACLNPHSQRHSPGGSSGGSSAALFANSADVPRLDFTLGTDTGGSVRNPASHCGVLGFKPSYGRISRLGVVPYANSLDTVGIMTTKEQGVGMIERVYRALDQPDSADPSSLNNEIRSKLQDLVASRQRTSLRIGVPEEYNVMELSASVRTTWKSCLEQLARLGHTLVPLSLPLTRVALSAYYILAPSEASSNLQKYSGVFYGARAREDRMDGRLYAATRDLFGDEVKRRILMGTFSLSASRYDNYYLQAQKIRRMIVQEFNRTFDMPHPLMPSRQDDTRVDYLVTPVAPTSAPSLDDVARMTPAEAHAGDVFTVPASMAGLPAISLPFGQCEAGLPIGMQIIGQYGDDQGVLNLARQL